MPELEVAVGVEARQLLGLAVGDEEIAAAGVAVDDETGTAGEVEVEVSEADPAVRIVIGVDAGPVAAGTTIGVEARAAVGFAVGVEDKSIFRRSGRHRGESSAWSRCWHRGESSSRSRGRCRGGTIS
jgi:hypothetical protein